MSASKKMYLDTSVFGGYFDKEFEIATKTLFKAIVRNSDIILLSSLTLEELADAPAFVRNLANQIKPDSVRMVNETIAAVVGKTSFADCLHIALATVNEADVLVSWNFKHIVNVTRIRGYNHVNEKLGYRSLRILSPEQLFKK